MLRRRHREPPRRVSPTDPAARWTAAPGGPAFYAYSTNYLVDTEAGIIVDVEATPAHRSQEVESTKTMVERVKNRFGIDTKKLIGDTAYGTAEFLAWMVNEKASSRMSRCGRKRNDPTRRSRARTSASMRRATLTPARTASCSTPRRRNFKTLRGIPTTDGHIRYRASVRDCGSCPLKQRCCPNTPARKVTRSVHESARDVARAIAQKPEYSITRRHRKKVEILFAHMKRILKVDRLRLRGLGGAREEFLLTAAAQNLRRMAKILGTGPPKICLAT